MNRDPLVIDQSYWRFDDKAWQQERKEKWPMIEAVLKHCQKNRKAINMVKRYYLKGELPDWAVVGEQYSMDDTTARHLDIATLLWLHPSEDVEVLKGLKDAYLMGYGRRSNDVEAGMYFINDWGIYVNSRNGSGYADWTADCVSFNGKEKLLFDVVYADLEGVFFNFGMEKQKYKIFGPGLHALEFSGDWLCYEKLNEHGEHMLLQHDFPLEIMFRTINYEQKKSSYALTNFTENYAKCLYRIFDFDTYKEGPSPRTTFVTKIRKVLDEGDHVPELKQLWEQVKRGEVTVDKPWEI